MKKKLLFIYNANAGKGHIKPSLSDVIEKLCRADYDITIYATGAPKEATQMVLDRGEDYDVVACSGGDGTISEVVTAIMQLEKQPLCAYFPTGTVNDFARSLKIPKDPVKAADVIIDGNLYACDIGSFQDKYFNYIAAFGAFTEVAYETPQNIKNSLGKLAYFLNALSLLPNIHGFNMKIETEKGTFEDEYIFGMICNSKSVGGFKLEGKKHKMRLDDGVFEVVLIRNPKNPIEFERTVNVLLAKDTDNPFIDTIKAKHIRITCDDEVKWTLDGEDGGAHQEVLIECHKRAIQIFSPKKNHKKKDKKKDKN